MITSHTPDTWQNLEKDVARILQECGFEVGKKKIETARGVVEVDVYAEEFVKGRKYSIVCECKHWTSAIPQAIVHGFRSVVSDIGANIGYIISLEGFQSGSFRVSEFTNITLLNWEEFQNVFEEIWIENYLLPTIVKNLDPLLSFTEPIMPAWFESLPDQEKTNFISLKEKYDEFGWLIMRFTPYAHVFRKANIPSLPLLNQLPENSSIRKNVPEAILNETGYREFLEGAISFGEEVIRQFREIRERKKI